jgi:hypothetical protein
MGSNDVCVLRVLVVKGRQLPSAGQILFSVGELGDMAEDCDLLDKLLQRPGMHGECGVVLRLLHSRLLRLLELSNPDSYNLLQLAADEIAERGIFPVA